MKEQCSNCKYYQEGKCVFRKPITVHKKDWCKEFKPNQLKNEDLNQNG